MDSLEDFVQDEVEGDNTPPLPARIRGAGRVRVLLKKFDNPREAEDFLQKENTWSISSNKRTVQGDKVHYRCNKGEYRSMNECPANR